MKRIRLLERYGDLFPGDEMRPEMDEVAARLVGQGIAEYVEPERTAASEKPRIKKQVWVKDAGNH